MSLLQRTESEDQSDLRLVAEVGLIGAVAQWCECLHGRDPLLKSLETLGKGLGAEIVAMVRYARDGGASLRSLAWDRAIEDGNASPVDRGFARALMGPYFEASRPGSLWFRSMVETGTTSDLEEFHTARHLRELAVIPLELQSRFVDTVEFHFRDRLRNHQQLILNSLAPVLATTWQKRAQGLFTEAILRPPSKASSRDLAPILSAENPARLSRAEYRVSLLLSRGLSIEQVQTELHIRESTLRSHLSSLYAKTNCSNLGELIYRLTSSAPTRGAPASLARLA
ncbi:helix-turn-helix transcriptional regulator [Tabrizicola caldifontis]|uniref:helix-turn-helix transcriptional regulator n=1 Tax=Tabrizicola caldifontis TaxID=2528036 RepID=UPI0010814A9F|nr:helix-turn-helix transcriptional regulator [Rhodobacter sp. YIM 73028]